YDTGVDGWSGEDNLTAGTIIDPPATTTPTEFTITSQTTGEGSGVVSGHQNPYTSGSTATLTATPNQGSSFTGWSGACTNTSGVCTVLMNGNKSVTASFTTNGQTSPTPPTPVITMPQFDGKVYPSSTTKVIVLWTSTSSRHFIYVQDKTDPSMNTITRDGVKYMIYRDPLAQSRIQSVNVLPGHTYYASVRSGTTNNLSAERTITWSVAPTTEYTITTQGFGAGSGSVSGNSSPYTPGSTATLTATANSGSTFTGWSGACTNTTGACNLTMDGNKHVVANFALSSVVDPNILAITSPANHAVLPANTISVTVTWNGSASNYLVRAQDETDNTKNTITKGVGKYLVYEDNQRTKSYTINNLVKGHSYYVWVHEGTATSFKPEVAISFSVANDTAMNSNKGLFSYIMSGISLIKDTLTASTIKIFEMIWGR
ncbi:MAG: hypothetical protein WCQ60_04120, partial [bacterium]